MSKKRLKNNSDSQDVLIKNKNSTETAKKNMTFSRVMIRLGAYVTYCVIFLIKKFNRLLCSCAKTLGSGATALISGTVKKLKKLGRTVLMPFALCVKPIKKKFTAKKVETDDVTVRSIRTTDARQFFSKAVSYAAPAAAVVVFAAILNGTLKFDSSITDVTYSDNTTEAVIDTEMMISAENDIDYAEAMISNAGARASAQPRSVDFEEPYQRFDELIGSADVNFAPAYGVYIDGEFHGAVINTDNIKEVLNKKLETIKSQDGIKDAVYKKKVEYRKGNYATTSIVDSKVMEDYFSSGTEERMYTIEEGDTLFLVAEDNGLTFEEFLEMNPDITDPNFCVIGMEVVVEQNLDNMPVLITRTIQESAVIPFETMTVDSETLFEGETEILIDGEDGESLDTLDVCYDGETEVSRKKTASEVVKEPVAEMIAVGTKKRAVDAKPALETTVLDGNGKFMWPVDGGYISDTFISNRNHKGMDIAAGAGTSIYAAADGKVIAAGWNTGGYGYFVMIDHGDGYATLYAHMSKVIAANGAEVKCGDIIGEVGTTGDSTGNHLHFEVRYNSVCQNPASYISVNSTKAVKEENTDITEDTETE